MFKRLKDTRLKYLFYIGRRSENQRWCTNQNQAHGVLRVEGDRDYGE